METDCITDQEVIREFLVESHENLGRLDQELVALEKHPNDSDLLGSVFRTMHTLKGSCGFLGFPNLEALAHQAESLLSQLRDGSRQLNPDLVSLILETVDATREILHSIERDGSEGNFDFFPLVERMKLVVEVTGNEPDLGSQRISNHPNLATLREEPWDGRERRAKASTSTEDDDISRGCGSADLHIRVRVGLLNKLMDLVGELVLVRNQILQSKIGHDNANLNAASQRLNLITAELQEGVMKARMQPIGTVWHTLPRIVRDAALSLGKQVEIKMDGADTELDRTIIEAIKDPLIHLVRNACDHGIEPCAVRSAAGKASSGTITLRAYHEGGQVNIEVGDDGAGIDIDKVKTKAAAHGLIRTDQAEGMSDREALNLIFHAGFSTAHEVTNLSGRGVGMDVVKSNVEKIGGAVEVTSQLGEGTTIKIRIPLTLFIIPGLVVNSGGERFVVPQASLLELIRLEAGTRGKHIEFIHGTPVYRRRERLLPVAYLNQTLGLTETDPDEAVSMAVLQVEDKQFCLVVDGIHDTQEIVVKPLGQQLKSTSVYAGATIMGDGRVALILDILALGRSAGVLEKAQDHAPSVDPAEVHREDQQSLLLFQAGSFERIAVPLSQVSRLEEVPQCSVEFSACQRVVQYRGGILPLVSLAEILHDEVVPQLSSENPLQVIVLSDSGRTIGLVVDKILDVVEEEIAIPQQSACRGLLGPAVVGRRITNFLDLNATINAAWIKPSPGQSASRERKS